MNTTFRKFEKNDRNDFFRMVKKFYAPPATLHTPPDEIMLSCFDEAVKNTGFVNGYMFISDGEISGYAIVSLKFETEVGGLAAWIEELYVEDSFRGKGIGSEFFAFLAEELHGKIRRIRLEVGEDNTDAIRLYKKLGLEFLDYKQMVCDKEY